MYVPMLPFGEFSRFVEPFTPEPGTCIWGLSIYPGACSYSHLRHVTPNNLCCKWLSQGGPAGHVAWTVLSSWGDFSFLRQILNVVPSNFTFQVFTHPDFPACL